jgi:hypothetical protein
VELDLEEESKIRNQISIVDEEDEVEYEEMRLKRIQEKVKKAEGTQSVIVWLLLGNHKTGAYRWFELKETVFGKGQTDG